ALAADRDRAGIPAVRHRLDTWDCPRAEERQNGAPIVGRAVAQLDRNRACRADGLLCHARSPQGLGGPPVQLLKDLVEAPKAAKSRCRGDLRHWQPRILNQLLGQKYPAGLGDCDRGSAEILPEQASKLTLADS